MNEQERDIDPESFDEPTAVLNVAAAYANDAAPPRSAARGTRLPYRGAPPAQAASGEPSPASEIWPNTDAELSELLRRAHWLGGQGREPLVSFTSLFLAFMGGGTPIANWVKATAEDMAVDPQAILDRWARVKTTFPSDIRLDHVRAPLAPQLAGNDITPSARTVLAAAVGYQTRLGATSLGASHVFAAYVGWIRGHDRDFTAWRVRVGSWIARFAVFVGQLVPDEADAWRSICVEPAAPDRSPRLIEVLELATTLAERQRKAAVEVADVVSAVVECGRRWAGQATAATWLVEQLAAASSTEIPGLVKLSSLDADHPRPRRDGTRAPYATQVETWLRDTQIWALVSAQGQAGVRHLIAAALAPRGPAAGKRMLRQAGGNPRQLAVALAQLIQDNEPSAENEPGEDHATWRWLLANDTAPHVAQRPDYASDVARGVDALSIGREVRALATVLASVDTKPPLSVGLFGNWGSGKSFFMAMLRDHIRTLAQLSCGAKQTAYCAEIAQIEFNAWHYIDGDLWASLVCHVLDSLENYFRGDAQSLAAQRTAELTTAQLRRAELDKQQNALDARRARLEAAVNAYSPSPGELFSVVVADATATVVDKTAEANAEVRKALDAAGRRIGLAPGELSLRKARDYGTALRAWWKQTSWKSIVIGGASLAVAAAATAAFATGATPEIAAAVITALTPVLALIGRIVHVGRPIAQAVRQATTKGQQVINQLARARPEAFHEQQQIEAAQRAIAAERDQLDQRADELRKLLAATHKPGMREYVLERSTQYRDKLGLIASVHRDFQNLSDQLRDDTTEPKLQRIILYIDDLDRCPPRRVVEVLQAIHLLLSFELFVVVVAVDPKWLLRSLEAYYARQFAGSPAIGHDRESRPQFYLEKIFQIPYALRPMDATRFSAMVGALLTSSVAPSDAGASPAVRDRGAAAAAVASPAPAASAQQTAAPAPVSHPAPRVDLTPRNLQITGAELDHLKQLGPLVSSPRAAKRLTNLYRLVRAGLDGDELDEFLEGRYELTQIILAAVVGCPDIAAAWFTQILGLHSGNVAVLLAPLEALVKSSARARFLYDRARPCIEASTWDGVIATCTLAARYSFETGALLELAPPEVSGRVTAPATRSDAG